MALPLDTNSGLPLDPATMQALQQQQLARDISMTGGNARERMNDMGVATAVNTLFPSPQMIQSRAADQALKATQLTQNPGEPDLDFSIRKLAAQRDALNPIDPLAAAGLNTQLLKLGQAKLEQAHLTADTQRMGDEHQQAVRQQTIEQATGIPIHLVGPNGKPLGDFDLSTDDGKQAYAAAKAQAPPGSVSMGDTQYAQHISRMQEIKERADEVAAAKARYGMGALGTFGDPKVEDLLASMAAKGVRMPTGFRSQQQQLATFQGLLKKYDGLSTDDIADLVGKGIIDFGAVQKATQTGATILGRVTAASGELDAMTPIARDASAAVPRSDFVPLNQLTQMVRTGTSSPEQKRLYVATQSILNQFDMLASRGGTDKDKRAALHKALETADGPEAYNAALDMIIKESQVARAGALGAIRAGSYGLAEQKAAAATTAPPSAPGAPNAGASAPQPGQQPPVRAYDPTTGTFK